MTTDPSNTTDPTTTAIETDYLAILAREAAMFRILKNRARRYPHEKLVTAIAEVMRDDRKF